MSYPSLATPTTGASVVAATSPRGGPRLSWRDPRIRRWILAGLHAGHAQAALLTFAGFLVIDRLALEPLGAEGPIAIVLMGGAAATLAAQWGVIPRVGFQPRTMLIVGSLVAAVGFAVLAFASDLYGLVLGFAIASLGFGFTRPGFTAGASLAVPMSEQGSVAGVITAANGLSYVAAPTLTMLLYKLTPLLPIGLCFAGLLALSWSARRLP